VTQFVYGVLLIKRRAAPTDRGPARMPLPPDARAEDMLPLLPTAAA
jgi:hypothetical protein